VGNCLKCHGVDDTAIDPHCLACHEEIDWLIAANRGLHGREARSECASCHPEHGGRDFELIEWRGGDPASFDHRRAGFPLEGKHAALACEKCHRTELHKSEVARIREGGLREGSWLGLKTACRDCHEDPHTGRLGQDCETCHAPEDWKKILETEFDHARTRWPLAGAHREVACAKCHDATTAWGPRPAFARCDDCHVDPHAGRATLAGKAVDCDACHSERWFRPSTYTAARHAESSWPLAGKHARVRCERCHPVATDAASVERLGAAGVDLRPASDRCTDCHADAHAGQLASRPDRGDCSSCHDPEGFRPSRFTVADHRSLDFPLRGRHAEVGCRACHGPDRPLLPPLPGPETLGDARVAFRPPAGDCVDCHQDPHGGRFSPGGERAAEESCRHCHDHRSFATSSVDLEIHARSLFPLEGAHRALPCLDCHRELERPAATSTLRLAPALPALSFRIAGRACVDCHADRHGGQFADRTDGGDCSACHGLDAFAPAVRFDHERDAAFALAGAHAKVACAACHATAVLPSGETGVVYRPLSSRCQDCHTNLPPNPAEEGT
jgi:hypothetical protein